MKIITEENYKEMTPNTDPFSIDDMPKDAKEAFLFLTSAYWYMLTKYLINKIGLKTLDNEIKQSELKFIPTEEENMDIYQWFNHNELTYLYLRNNVHIFNLTKEEREQFLEILKKENGYTEGIEKFIEATYRKVIYENTKESPCLVNFGPVSESFMAPNNSLVIGIRYDEFNFNNMSDDEWDQNHDKQIEYIYELSERISKIAKEKLDAPCSLIKYNEFSIKKKQATR